MKKEQQIAKDEATKLCKKYYIYYSCFAEDTVENFLTAMDYRELYGILINNKDILREVEQTKANFAREQELKVDKKVG